MKRIAALLLGAFLAVSLAIAAAGFWVWSGVEEMPVEFSSGELRLRGTLLMPRKGNALPGVVLVHGSGQVTRRSMMAYGWMFAARGQAALVYDKRGVGQSEGEPEAGRYFSFDELAADAAAAHRYLSARPEVAEQGVGFVGASQGAWVVALAATLVEAPAFLVMASASLSTVAEDRLFGRKAQLLHAGFSSRDADEAVALLVADHEASRTPARHPDLLALADTYESRAWFAEVYPSTDPRAVPSDFRRWQRTVLDFDPRPLLAGLDVPVLWIFGDPGLDRFAPVELGMSRVEAAQREGACYAMLQLADVGHTLQPHDGGFATELIVRVGLLSDVYAWLDRVASAEVCASE